jgi:hypothetical protein
MESRVSQIMAGDEWTNDDRKTSRKDVERRVGSLRGTGSLTAMMADGGTLMDLHPHYSGFLKIQTTRATVSGYGKRTWRRRYCVLYSHSLRYYREQSQEHIKGEMVLNTHTTTRLKSNPRGVTKPNSFALENTAATIIMSADSEQESQRWQGEIQKVLDPFAKSQRGVPGPGIQNSPPSDNRIRRSSSKMELVKKYGTPAREDMADDGGGPEAKKFPPQTKVKDWLENYRLGHHLGHFEGLGIETVEELQDIDGEMIGGIEGLKPAEEKRLLRALKDTGYDLGGEEANETDTAAGEGVAAVAGEAVVEAEEVQKPSPLQEWASHKETAKKSVAFINFPPGREEEEEEDESDDEASADAATAGGAEARQLASSGASTSAEEQAAVLQKVISAFGTTRTKSEARAIDAMDRAAGGEVEKTAVLGSWQGVLRRRGQFSAGGQKHRNCNVRLYHTELVVESKNRFQKAKAATSHPLHEIVWILLKSKDILEVGLRGTAAHAEGAGHGERSNSKAGKMGGGKHTLVESQLLLHVGVGMPGMEMDMAREVKQLLLKEREALYLSHAMAPLWQAKKCFDAAVRNMRITLWKIENALEAEHALLAKKSEKEQMRAQLHNAQDYSAANELIIENTRLVGRIKAKQADQAKHRANLTGVRELAFEEQAKVMAMVQQMQQDIHVKVQQAEAEGGNSHLVPRAKGNAGSVSGDDESWHADETSQLLRLTTKIAAIENKVQESLLPEEMQGKLADHVRRINISLDIAFVIKAEAPPEYAVTRASQLSVDLPPLLVGGEAREEEEVEVQQSVMSLDSFLGGAAASESKGEDEGASNAPATRGRKGSVDDGSGSVPQEGDKKKMRTLTLLGRGRGKTKAKPKAKTKGKAHSSSDPNRYDMGGSGSGEAEDQLSDMDRSSNGKGKGKKGLKRAQSRKILGGDKDAREQRELDALNLYKSGLIVEEEYNQLLEQYAQFMGDGDASEQVSFSGQIWEGSAGADDIVVAFAPYELRLEWGRDFLGTSVVIKTSSDERLDEGDVVVAVNLYRTADMDVQTVEEMLPAALRQDGDITVRKPTKVYPRARKHSLKMAAHAAVQAEREEAVDSRYVHEMGKATQLVLAELEQKSSMILHYKTGSERKEWLELYLRSYCVGLYQRLEKLVLNQSLAQLIPHDMLTIIEIATSCDAMVTKIRDRFNEIRTKEEAGRGNTTGADGAAGAAAPRGGPSKRVSTWRYELQLPHISFSELLVVEPELIERYTEKSEEQLSEWMCTIFSRRETAGSDGVDQDSNGILMTTAPTDLFQTFNSHLSIGLESLAPIAASGGSNSRDGGDDATKSLLKALLHSCFKVLCEYQRKISASLITQNDAIYMAATANDCWLMLDNIDDLADSYAYVLDGQHDDHDDDDDDENGEQEEEEEEEQSAMELDLQRVQQGFGKCATTAITRLVDIQFDKFKEEQAALFTGPSFLEDGITPVAKANAETHGRAVNVITVTLQCLLADFREALNDYCFRKLVAASAHRTSVLYLSGLFRPKPAHGFVIRQSEVHVMQEDHSAFLACLQQFVESSARNGSRSNMVEQGLKPIMDVFVMLTLPNPIVTITSELVDSMSTTYPGEHVHLLAAGAAVVRMRDDVANLERDRVVENLIAGTHTNTVDTLLIADIPHSLTLLWSFWSFCSLCVPPH